MKTSVIVSLKLLSSAE